ncbi:DNA polymerase IV [Bacillus sp. HMF5848]|uniref:DNA polymerase IV n=1 Tax=Bacillus sp. HMF5848 TaxID=2495421 RepID=UPI000F7A0144|nr:DNA polymerase IV [Bacillus sp. HMF5848]RSK28375.1 DNA polymerase IV [Bacillus sp. HMF5848]
MSNERIIMLADCQSFYASVEKAAHPEYRDKPLVVSGDPKRRSGIILAACPLAKAYGVTTAEPLGEALRKCPEAIVVRPRMQDYIRVSLQISRIFQTFSDLVEPYSIDEQFIDVTGSQRLFGDPLTIAKAMQQKVWNETGVYIRVGISYSKVTAKMACDNFAKKNKEGVFYLKKDELQSVLWPLPIQKMFMVGSRMTQHFIRMGISSIGQLAKTPLPLLEKRWGVNGRVLWQIANGIDNSAVTPQTHNSQKGVGHQMTLPRDYKTLEDILIVLLELTEQVCNRCRNKSKMGWVVSVGCQGADFNNPQGFHRQVKMACPTNATNIVYEVAKKLFMEHWQHYPIRRIGVSLTELELDNEYQLMLFDQRETYRELERTTDLIKQKYGDTAIMRAVSLKTASQLKDRTQKIGGHYK